jgi:hypothetical protein
MTPRFYAGESRFFGFLTVDSFLSSIFDINVVIANGSCAASDMLISATNVDSEEPRFLNVNNFCLGCIAVTLPNVCDARTAI